MLTAVARTLGPIGRRARAVQLRIAGHKLAAVCETLGCNRRYVLHWLHRYRASGVAGLVSLNSGRAQSIEGGRRKRIADKFDRLGWRHRWGQIAAIAAQSGVSRATVRRIGRFYPRRRKLRQAGYPVFVVTFLWENRFDLVGFYSGPDAHTAVFHVRSGRVPTYPLWAGLIGKPYKAWGNAERQEVREWLRRRKVPTPIDAALRLTALARTPERLDAELRAWRGRSLERFLEAAEYRWPDRERYIIAHVTTPHAKRILRSFVGKSRTDAAFSDVDELPTRRLWEQAVAAVFSRIEEDLTEEQPGSPSVAPLTLLLHRLSRLPVSVAWVDDLAPGPKPRQKPETEKLREDYERRVAAGEITPPRDDETLGEYARRPGRPR